MTSKIGPALELQGAYVAALKDDAAVKKLIGDPPRINPDQSTKWAGSYITIGEGQSVPDLAECIDGREIFHDIHIWSRADKSFADASRIAATIWDCLSGAALALTENRLIGDLEPAGEHKLRDPDGTTLHIVLTIRAQTEPAA